jgi:hypothetical protein
MGTIVIEQYNALGSAANRDAPIYDLQSLLVTTADATTSTTAETITLGINTRAVSIYALENHRVQIGADAGTTYAFIPAGSVKDFGVTPGTVLQYRLDA